MIKWKWRVGLENLCCKEYPYRYVWWVRLDDGSKVKVADVFRKCCKLENLEYQESAIFPVFEAEKRNYSQQDIARIVNIAYMAGLGMGGFVGKNFLVDCLPDSPMQATEQNFRTLSLCVKFKGNK